MWIQQDSCPDYMLKAEDCLRAEEERVNNYLHQSSKTKLLEQVRRVARLGDAFVCFRNRMGVVEKSPATQRHRVIAVEGSDLPAPVILGNGLALCRVPRSLMACDTS